MKMWSQNIIYYYKVVINNAYGKSLQSVNVMGWLVGTKKASALTT